jgi:hypothetical protein
VALLLITQVAAAEKVIVALVQAARAVVVTLPVVLDKRQLQALQIPGAVEEPAQVSVVQSLELAVGQVL